MFKQILDQIIKYDTIIIHRHVRPDGDCIGSSQGLKRFIKLNFPEKHVYTVGDAIPDYLSAYGENEEISDDIYNGSLVIVVDTANEKRICDGRYNTGEFLIKIDHHDDSPHYGDINYTDPSSPACASILADMFRLYESMGYIINEDVANCLYLAITTDTGRFRYRGVNGKTLANAGWLLDKGVDTEKMFSHLYIKEKEVLKLQGYVYNNFKMTENGVAYICFTKSIMEKFNVTKEDAANLVNSLDSINGSLIWCVFVDQMLPPVENLINKKEDPTKEVRVRIRSRFVSINEVATHYRGGGHLQAAGATIYSTKERKSLLNELDILLKEYKENNPEAF